MQHLGDISASTLYCLPACTAGLSGSGKSTVACTLEHLLHERGHFTSLLDGDNIRHGLNSDLGFRWARGGWMIGGGCLGLG